MKSLCKQLITSSALSHLPWRKLLLLVKHLQWCRGGALFHMHVMPSALVILGSQHHSGTYPSATSAVKW